MLAQPLTLPTRSPPPRRVPRVFAEPSTDESGAQFRPLILTVDDEPDALEFLRVFLTGEGFDVLQATSGAQAFQLIEERRPDLVIVDVMMAGMTGFELCDLLRSNVALRDVPIIVYSAHETKQYSNSGLYDLAFVKPAEPEDLLWAIRTLLPDDGG